MSSLTIHHVLLLKEEHVAHFFLATVFHLSVCSGRGTVNDEVCVNAIYWHWQDLQLDHVSRTERLQKALLEYLAHSSDSDPSLVVSLMYRFSFHFHYVFVFIYIYHEWSLQMYGCCHCLGGHRHMIGSTSFLFWTMSRFNYLSDSEQMIHAVWFDNVRRTHLAACSFVHGFYLASCIKGG